MSHMFLLGLSILISQSTVCWGEQKPLKPYKDMEVRLVVKCHIPAFNETKFNVTLMEGNRGRNAWFNADREVASNMKAKFMEVIYLKGMMRPEVDGVLEPYLLISHKCDMRKRKLEGCIVLPKNENWSDAFPPPYFHDAGSINVDELESCPE